MFLIDSEGVVVAREVSSCMDILIVFTIYRMITFFILIRATSINTLVVLLGGGLALRSWCQGSKEIGHVPCR